VRGLSLRRRLDDGRGPVHDHWLDLERAVLTVGDPLKALPLQGAFGYRRRVLVKRPPDDAGLWLLDLARSTLSPVGADHACSGRIDVEDARGDWVLINCFTRRGLAWGEAVDLKGRRRFRTRQVRLMQVTPGGLVLGQRRDRGSVVVMKIP
jgi:hypothetical protein